MQTLPFWPEGKNLLRLLLLKICPVGHSRRLCGKICFLFGIEAVVGVTWSNCSFKVKSQGHGGSCSGYRSNSPLVVNDCKWRWGFSVKKMLLFSFTVVIVLSQFCNFYRKLHLRGSSVSLKTEYGHSDLLKVYFAEISKIGAALEWKSIGHNPLIDYM